METGDCAISLLVDDNALSPIKALAAIWLTSLDYRKSFPSRDECHAQLEDYNAPFFKTVDSPRLTELALFASGS